MRTSRLLVLGFSLLVVGALLGSVVVRRPAQQPGDAPLPQLEVMTDVMQHISEDYVTQPDMLKVTDGGLHGLLESLDADSSYLNPAEYQAYLASQKHAADASLGVVFAKRGGYAVVVDVTPGGPAAQAGMARGDFAEVIDLTSTRDMSIQQVQSDMRGAPGSSLSLSVVHHYRTDPARVSLTRRVLAPQPLGVSMQGTVGVIHVPDFDKGRAAQVAAALRDLTRRGATGLVLDLRDCGDGQYVEAEQTANLFLAKGEIDYLEGQKMPRVTVNADPAKAVAPTLPAKVLINMGTSGPAEVVAAALENDGRAQTIGDHTFGEGAVQKLIELGDGSAVLLSVARYYSPKGATIEDGLTPDLAQVQYAGALNDEDFPPEGVNPATLQDLQMQKALDLLKSPAPPA